MPVHYKPLIKSGFGIGISGQHVFVESGAYAASGQHVVISGQPVTISGNHVFVESGVYVIADIAESGMGVQIQSGAHVQISGQHVYVESGVYVIADIEIVASSGLLVQISGQHVFVESGVYLASGLYVVADIAESGIGVQVQSGLHVIISGQHLYQESGAFVTTQPSIAVSGTVSVQSGVVDVLEYGYHILSGEWRPKAVCDSGEIVVCSGLYVVADIAESGIGVQVQSGLHVIMSGQHVFQESGAFVTTQPSVAVSGTVSVQSGVVDVLEYGYHILSGEWRPKAVCDSGEIVVCSGLYVVADIAESGIGVQVQSGAHVQISGQHVFVESGVYLASGMHVVADIAESGIGVQIQSGAHVQISGQATIMVGCDYIQSGTDYCSGQVRIPTVMRGFESSVSGCIDISGVKNFAYESRLFVGADSKHIRFHDTFDGKALDSIKWNTDGNEIVASGRLETGNVVFSKEKFLYGILSFTATAAVWTDGCKFGFFADYEENGAVKVYYDTLSFVTENPGIGVETTTTIVPALVDNTWYNFDIVWTPSYAQLWIDGELRATHKINIPSSPAYILLDGVKAVRVANVSLKPYGDIPLTVRGAVPIAGIDISGQYVPILTNTSGKIIIQSGLHVVADIAESGIGVQVQSGLHVIMSGQHVFVESGVHVVTQPSIAISGTVQVQSGVTDVREYGYHILSGEWRPKAVCDSGEIVVCSGLYVVADIAESGIGVQVQSGLHVIMSGQHLYQESGAFVTTQPSIAVSGTVSVQSGIVDVREYGYHILSGEWRPKAVCSSGEIVVCSGLYVVADIAESGIGVQIQSGVHVQISGQHVFVESGAIGINAMYAWKIDTNAWTKVEMDAQKKLLVTISGQHLFQESGAHVVIESGIGVTTVVDISGTPITISGGHVFVESGAYGTVDIITPTTIDICSGSNPLTLTTQAAVPLCSGECIAVIVKAVGDNDGDLYFGGHETGKHPFCSTSGSEQGFKIAPGEAFNIDIDDRGKVWVCACTSGDKVTFIANN